MKYITIILLALFSFSFSASAQQDVIADFFETYEDHDEFTVISISPKMFQMIATIEVDEMEQDVKDVLNDLQGLRILTTEDDGMKYYKELASKMKFSSYEELMKVRDGDDNVRIMVKEGSNSKINELLLLVGSEESFVLLSFMGKIDLNKIAKLSGTIDIDGVDYLDQLGDDKNNN